MSKPEDGGPKASSFEEGWKIGFLRGIEDVGAIAKNNGDTEYELLCSALVKIRRRELESMKPLGDATWKFKTLSAELIETEIKSSK